MMRLTCYLLALSLALAFASMAQARILAADNCLPVGDTGQTTLYQIDEVRGTYAPLGTLDVCGVTGLSKRRDGAIYAVNAGNPLTSLPDPMEPHLFRIVPDPDDPDRFVGEVVGPIGIETTPETVFSFVTALAFAPDDTLYAIERLYEGEMGDISQALWRLNPDTGQAEHRVGLDVDNRVLNIDFSPDTGGLFGWDALQGLVEIDITTGALRNVTPDDDVPADLVPTRPITRITFLPDGNLLAVDYFGTSFPVTLYLIDIETGDRRSLGVTLEPMILLAVEHMDDQWITFAPGRRRPTGPPRWDHNLSLIDCLPCPPCSGPGKMCDPRVNENWDRAFINDPLNDIAISFSRAAIGFTAKDGFLKAGAPVSGAETDLFVVSAPLADAGQGAIVFFSAKGKPVARIDAAKGETLLGHDMDVRGDHVAVVSTTRLLRFQGSKQVANLPLDERLMAHRDIQVAFTNDIDGDGAPEILLGGPQATVKDMPLAGMLQVVGSASGKVIDTRTGTKPGQRLGAAPEWEDVMK